MQYTSKVILCFVFLFASCSVKKVPEKDATTEFGTRMAFMSDVHLLDVHGTLADVNYSGIKNPTTDDYVLIRSMDAQLHSTRLFNENYFAFRAALDDAVQRGIELIILPGDFSDDGQPLNVRGLNRILDEYSAKHGISFFLTTGNHDPKRPFDTSAGKSDFLGNGGKLQPIMSEAGMYVSNPDKEHPTIISEDIKAFGYEGIVNGLQNHGFFPQTEYRYWETPFSEYKYENYSFEKAKEASHLENRNYPIRDSQTGVPDVSYLVEPSDGLWLLALDANVYLPTNQTNQFQGAGIGYNEVLAHKKHLVVWAAKVAKEAKRLGKSLIAFSHYPMVDFNDGASKEIAELLGENALQAHRIPDEKVAEVFADAGIQIHVGGHMHLNDTGIYTSVSGNTLFNIQVPSIAAYKPAYKIVTIQQDSTIQVKTITLDSVTGFDEFFALYSEEHKFLQTLESENVWGRNILKSKNYREYTNWHLKELVRLRLLPEDWPSEVQHFFLGLNGEQFLLLSNTDDRFSKNDLQRILTGNSDLPVWNDARGRVQEILSQEGLDAKDFKDWTGFDLIYDFYRLRSADKLAEQDIGKDRLMQYQLLLDLLQHKPENPNFHELWVFGSIFQKQLHGDPAMNFIIDLKKGGISPY